MQVESYILLLCLAGNAKTLDICGREGTLQEAYIHSELTVISNPAAPKRVGGYDVVVESR